MVTLYTKPGCVQCKATYRYLDKKGIAYQSVDVSVDNEALDKIVSMGYQQAPVVIAGDVHWSGFRPDMIEGLVAS